MLVKDVSLKWDVSQYSIMVEVGEFVQVKKHNWGKNVGWIDAEIRVYARQLTRSRVQQVIAELRRAERVAYKLDDDPEWRGAEQESVSHVGQDEAAFAEFTSSSCAEPKRCPFLGEMGGCCVPGNVCWKRGISGTDLTVKDLLKRFGYWKE